MKNFLKTGLMTLAASSLFLAAPALALTHTPAQEGLVDSGLTSAASEMQLFHNHLAMAHQQIQKGNYDSAYRQANDARYWFLAFADSLGTERAGYNWDASRTMETDLLAAYTTLGQKYQLAGNPQQAINTYAMSLSVNPYQPDTRYQQLIAYINLEDDIADADDGDVLYDQNLNNGAVFTDEEFMSE